MANLKALFPRVADKFDTAMQELEHEAEQRKKEQEESNRARVEQERQAAEQKQSSGSRLFFHVPLVPAAL